MLLHIWIPTATMQLGGISISLYGLSMALGLIGAYCLMLWKVKKFDKLLGTDVESHIDGLFWWVFIPALIGARALFIVYHSDYFLSAPQEMIAIWHGGIVWHGALVGGILGSLAYCAWRRLSWLGIADVAAPAIAAGQALGRWGNYFNQENYGVPTSLPWGIPIDEAHRLPGFEQFTYFHPTFLYESLWDALLCILLLYLAHRLIFQRIALWYRSGMVFMLYLLLYSLGRFAIEFLRIDTVPVFWGLRLPQWWSIDLMIIAVVCLGALYMRRKTNACISQKR